jgi:hypothetical protein
MSNDLERMCKEEVIAELQVVSWHFRLGPEENCGSPQDNRSLGIELDLRHPEYSPGGVLSQPPQ